LSSLSIVIPAYNEERRLPQTLRLVLDWLARGTFSFHDDHFAERKRAAK
jgi:glycosyltransferase involved in cell wall biosynthesis